MKTKIIPFDLETAKKIQAGETTGRITTKEGKDVRIICTDKVSADDENRTQIVCLIKLGTRDILSINDPNTGLCWDIEAGEAQHLVLEVLDNEPQFKPFDKVLVRNKSNERWHPSLYATTDGLLYYTTDCKNWQQCIPYEGNEHLVGTTDKPEED